MFNFFSTPSIVSSILCFAIGVFTLLKNPKAKVNRIFFVQATSACIWQLGTFFLLISKEPTAIEFWARFTYIGAIFIPVATFHLAVEFLAKKALRKFIWLGYLLGAGVFLPLTWSPYLLSGSYTYYWGPWFKAGIAHPIYLLFFISFMLSGLVCLYFTYRKRESRIEKRRMVYLFAAYIIAYTGAVDFLPDYGVEFFPFGSISVFLYIVTVSYAIVKYRLMQIDVVVKRTVIFGGLFVFVAFVLITITHLAQLFLSHFIGAWQWLVLVFSAPVIVFTMEPLKQFLTHITDRALFQKKYDYQQTLKEASEGMTLVTDMKKLLRLIVRVVSKNIRVKSAAIFQLDEGENKYVLRVSRGATRRHAGYFLEKDNALIWWLRTHRKVLLYDDIEEWLKTEKLFLKEEWLKAKLINIKKELSRLSGAICIPSFIKGNLIGFLILGEKLSGDVYTLEDVRVFSILANEVAISLENAKNFMELKRLQEIEKMQIRTQLQSDFVANVAHEFRSPLTILKGNLDLIFKGHLGRVTSKQKEMLYGATNITNRLSRLVNDLLDISKIEAGKMHLKRGEMNINNIINENLVAFGKIIKNKKQTLKKDLAKDMPTISADVDKITQVFVNLLNNALKYTPEKGIISIKTVNLKEKITVEVSDTGEGVAPENVDKIFDKFTRVTAEKKEGTGLGLPIAKDIIMLHKGNIWVETETGKGSKFIFTLPK